MLVLINPGKLSAFPHAVYDYTDADNPILISEAPYRFNLLAQRVTDYMCCGLIVGEVADDHPEWEEVSSIPDGFEQRCLPPRYGCFLSLEEIKEALKKEKQEEIRLAWRSEIDDVGMPVPGEDYRVDFDVEDALIWENGLAISTADPVEIRAKDNTMHIMTREVALTIPPLQKQHYAQVLQKKWTLQKQASEAETIEDIQAIAWN